MTAVARHQRHTRRNPCPICGGYDEAERGRGRRCSGWTSRDGEYVRCSREELAGGLAEKSDGTFTHRAKGPCRCGVEHGPTTGGKVVSIEEASYVYRDEKGSALYEVVRRTGKRFAMRQPDGSPGLNGARRVPYRLDELAAAPSDRIVYVVEGEKDADALASRGLLATCNPNGAGKWKHVEGVAASVLRGRKVVVIADADDKGRAHAQDVRSRLEAVASDVRVVELPQKDASDFFAAGGTKDELEALCHEPTVLEGCWTSIPIGWLDHPPPPRRWLLRHPTVDGGPCAPGRGDGMLTLGRVGILAAAGGTGKTMVACQLAASVATGRPWLDHFTVGEPGKVILALAEEDEEEVQRRIHAVVAGMRLAPEERAHLAARLVVLPMMGQRVRLVDEAGEPTAMLNELRSRLDDEAWRLLILDPLSRWAPSAEKDNDSATAAMQAIESLCHTPGRPTVLVCAHSSKLARRIGEADTRGVTGQVDAARWEAQMVSGDGGQVSLRQTKSNYSRPWPDPGELILRRGSHGVLEVVSEAELEHREEERKAARDERKEEQRRAEHERRVAQIVSRVKELGPKGASNIDGLVSGLGLARNPGRAAANDAMDRGLIARVGRTRTSRIVAPEFAEVAS